MPLPAASKPVLRIRRRGNRTAWLLWIVVSVLCATLGAVVGWQIRWLFLRNPATTQLLIAYVATVASALLVSGAQWLLFRHYRRDVYWWVPATVAGNLAAAAIIVPGVTSLAFAKGISPLNADTALFYGLLALATSGLVVGTAQALVLRTFAGNLAWAWVPATILGSGLAGAITTGLSSQLVSMTWFWDHPLVLIALASAVGGLLVSASQAPVFSRLLR